MKWSAILLLAAGAWAQEPRFSTHAREVVVPVSVTNKDGKPVAGLEAGDFELLSDGKPQAARLISGEALPLPIHAVLVIQTSSFTDPALAKIKKTAGTVSGYITNDMDTGNPSLAAVVSTSDEVGTVQDFTSDANELKAAFQKLRSGGDGARLLDGVNLACDLLLERKDASRRVIVLIGESRDRGSKTKIAEMAAKAQQGDIAIYTLSYSAYTTAFTQKASERPEPPDQPGSYDPSNHGGANLLALALELARMAKVNTADALAEASGGRHEKFTTLRGLEAQLAAVGSDVHGRYMLTFVPPAGQEDGFHAIAVNVRGEADWKIHARSGYWSQ